MANNRWAKTGNIIYCSIYGVGTSGGTISKPCRNISLPNNMNTITYGIGTFSLYYDTMQNSGWIGTNYGMGMYDTIINLIGKAERRVNTYDLTFIHQPDNSHGSSTYTRTLLRDGNITNGTCYNSIVTNNNKFVAYMVNCTAYNQLLPIEATRNYYSTSSVFHDCTFVMGSNIINNFLNGYNLFSNSKFMFEGDTTNSTYTLQGNTSTELKQSFVDLCLQFGVNFNNAAPTVKALSKWIFSNNSFNELTKTIIIDSDADRFQKANSLYLGHTQPSGINIPITKAITASSFNDRQGKQSRSIVVDDSYIHLDETATQNKVYLIKSAIIPFSKLKKVTKINLMSAISASNVFASTTSNLINAEFDNIKADMVYIVRSNDANNATVVYNGVSYNSGGIFYGVANVTAVTSKSDNAVLYEVTDQANARTVDIRVGSAPLSGNITEGKLALGYWYFIEANDLNNPSGSIIYNGNVYPVGSSFLSVADADTFTIDGDCHLRKMMIDDENENPFISVLPNDARYVKQSYASDKPIIGSDGKPIGSGHREFANYENSQIGATNIANFVGTFMQIRIGINIEK